MAFMAKDCLRWQEVVMHFESNSIALCTGSELAGLAQLVLTELGFKMQTLRALWDRVTQQEVRRTKPPQPDAVHAACIGGHRSQTGQICLSGSPASLIWRKAFEWGAEMVFYSMNRKRKHVQGTGL